MYVLKSDLNHQQAFNDIKAKVFGDTHLSIYLPLERNSDSYSLRVRFKNASKKLSQLNLPEPAKLTIEDNLEILSHVLSMYQLRKDLRGIALFKSRSQLFHTAVNSRVSEMTSIGHYFNIDPLLNTLATKASCYVFSVTPKQFSVYLLHGEKLLLEKVYDNHNYIKSTRSIRNQFGKRKKMRRDATFIFLRNSLGKVVLDFNLENQDIALIGRSDIRRYIKGAFRRNHYNTRVFYETRYGISLEDLASKISTKLDHVRLESIGRTKESWSQHDGSIMTSNLEDLNNAALQGRIERLAIDPYWRAKKNLHYLQNYTGSFNPKRPLNRNELNEISRNVLKSGGDVILFDSSRKENIPPYLATLRW